MKLAFVAPLAESVPPAGYGGTERVVAWLVEELVARGHDVTLFASGDSLTSARLVPIVPRALRPSGTSDHAAYHLAMLGEVFARAGEFDLVHAHVDHLAFPFARLARVPVVHTLHGRLDAPWLAWACARSPELHLVSISEAQRAPLPDVRFTTIHHGFPRGLFRFHPRGGDYVLFLGRISREKGPLAAIEAARAAGVPLKIAAKIDPHDGDLFEREIAPRLDPPRVEYLGEVGDAEKEELLGNARALLLPIEWPEPFGLAFIEAMACGTPVITRPRGSVPEIVRHGVDGLVAESVEELARAIRDVGAIDRARCRASFEARFTVERMADDYEALYRAVLARRGRDVAEVKRAG